MFGLSFSEVLVIAILAAAVWYAVRRARRAAAAGKRSGAGSGPGGGSPGVEDMVKCPVCDLYVPASAPTACDRSDCPYRR